MLGPLPGPTLSNRAHISIAIATESQYIAGMTNALTRDLVKTLSFACVHFSVAFGIGYLLTGSFAIATGMALIEPMANTVAFFFHEQAWKRFGTGSNEAPQSALASFGLLHTCH